jgi:cyclohexadieny/prephenate dehydrogenase
MKLSTLTVVGVGLIGGSVGLAARRRGVAGRVLGVSRPAESLGRAWSVGAIDEGFVDAAPAVAEADLVVVCTPVDHVAAEVLAAAPHGRPTTLFTDVGSTKAVIVRAVDGRLPRGAFVGSHPLAGSEKRGLEHADADLFQDRVAVVTPTPSTDPAAVQRVAEFWQALGANVVLMSPEEHDRAVALTSHLPHLVAAALAGILPPDQHHLAATGFRDTTRVAAGDPSVWTGIFRQNRSAVLAALDRLGERLLLFRRALEADDSGTLDHLLGQAKKVRDALGSCHPGQGQ